MNNNFIITLVFIIFYPVSAYAYLDPGTGSIILQAILGGIAAGFMTISIWWHKFKLLISKLSNIFRKKKKKD